MTLACGGEEFDDLAFGERGGFGHGCLLEVQKQGRTFGFFSESAYAADSLVTLVFAAEEQRGGEARDSMSFKLCGLCSFAPLRFSQRTRLIHKHYEVSPVGMVRRSPGAGCPRRPKKMTRTAPTILRRC